MILRDYRKEDAPVIAGWIRSEEELYRWSADRFNKYPLYGDDINESYSQQLETGRFFPLTATEDRGKVIGHFIIRYPKENDDSSVRIGFVIVNPGIRGKGYGREMMQLAVKYVKDNLTATRVDLGVFDNNPKARKCYESVGFRDYGSHTVDTPYGLWNCTDMELYI